ncbi:hypothetical protein EDB80DRAFT_721172 [Ilyonectria destructans]|nr:hypothetical protein EDB80DRAFT_721172 [Ilyonectria destructans]
MQPGQREYHLTALQFAAKDGIFIISGFLIRHGADVNAKSTKHGRTALEEAAENGRLGMV